MELIEPNYCSNKTFKQAMKQQIEKNKNIF